MLAILAAVLFLVDLILWAADAGTGKLIEILMFAGLVLLSLHLAGVGSGLPWRHSGT